MRRGQNIENTLGDDLFFGQMKDVPNLCVNFELFEASSPIHSFHLL